MRTLGGTTTARVVDLNITREAYIGAFRVCAEKSGFAQYDPDPGATARAEAEEHIRLAARFPAGVVVERRGMKIQIRRTF
jgi:hypothetical protein